MSVALVTVRLKLGALIPLAFVDLCCEKSYLVVFFNLYTISGLQVNDMNKNDLAAVVAVKTGTTKSYATKVLNSVLDGIADALSEGKEVRLIGFGTFRITQRNASQGRNPRTGERIMIPASLVPRFKAGKALKEAIN